MAQTIDCQFLGLREYSEVLALQRRLREQRIRNEIPDTLITVQHPRVITRGRRPAEQDFKISPSELERRGFHIVDAGRGGLLTYHGPGQLVGYFIFSLRARHLSVPQFVKMAEEIILETLVAFNLKAERKEGCPGIWFKQKKIASIGLSIDRGVSMHGVALNVAPKLEDFEVIVPCGIRDCEMTSMEKEMGRSPEFSAVERVFCDSVREVFNFL